ncbi:MAG: hypothetical protein ACRDZR_14995, partial [Acidimicrobiales bacterium]
MRKRALAFLSVLSLLVAMAVVSGNAAAAPSQRTTRTQTTGVSSSSLGEYSPTYVGPAATGCASDCSLLTGPYFSPSTASLSEAAISAVANSARHAASLSYKESAIAKSLTESASRPDTPRVMPSPVLTRDGADPTPPTVSCPSGPGCDSISSSAGGATAVNGLDAVDSAEQSTNVTGLDIEPPDQALCADNRYVVEDNNIGEILVFNTSLQRESSVIPLDTVMGLTSRGWS